MKVNANQVNSNYSGVTNHVTGNQTNVPKQEKTSENMKEFDFKSKSEFGLKSKSELSLDEKQLIEVIEKTNKAIEGTTCSFEYSIHEETKQIMVKVVDNVTKDVIREFPPEKILDMVAKMWEVAGIIVDERR